MPVLGCTLSERLKVRFIFFTPIFTLCPFALGVVVLWIVAGWKGCGA